MDLHEFISDKNRCIDTTEGVYVTFGNNHYGYNIPLNKFTSLMWLHFIRRSIYNGDVALYVDGVIKRSMWNGDKKILDKNSKYTYWVEKYL